MSDLTLNQSEFIRDSSLPRVRGRTSAEYLATKRFLDIIITGWVLVVLAPVILVAVIAIKLESRGPALFKQQRVGKDGRLFDCYKLRSMCADAEAIKSSLSTENEMSGGVTFKIRHDPRITRVGRFIRKFSIDELPQLLNVLKGDMSLVGPRPPIPKEVAQYTAYERQRLSIVPGITCLWQISGRSELPFKEQVKLDLAYIEARSIWLDIKLLLSTVPAVIGARGAW